MPFASLRDRVLFLGLILALPHAIRAGDSAGSSGAPPGPAGTWRLAFEDTFDRAGDRAELGDDWEVLRGRAVVRDGAAVLTGSSSRLVTRREFAPDVCVEVVASAHPDMPPCDLSVVLGPSEFLSWGYLLAFGGNNNQLHQILGHRVRVVDRASDRLIEPGRTYRLLARREGSLLTYTVDGDEILRARLEDPLGGAGFGRVGCITWTGMVIDSVRIWERRERHPDTPEFLGVLRGLPLRRDVSGSLVLRDPEVASALDEPQRQALDRGRDAFREGRLDDAWREFRTLPEGLLRATALAFAAGHPAREESPEERAALATELAALDGAEAGSPPPEPVRNLALAAAELSSLRIVGGSMVSAIRLRGAGEAADNPFRHLAELYLARYVYWNGREGGDQREIGLGLTMMRELRKEYPDHPVLREYTGDPPPWAEDLSARPEGVPAWAADLREAYARQLRILRYWLSKRQRSDGSLGGGWGDDVEILRDWFPVALISTAAPDVAAGIERLCEGVWRHVLVDGYTPDPGDVEHSAEPSADTLPPMLLLRHGDPLWYERNLVSARTLRDVLTARDERGHIRFRSTEIGSRGQIPTSPRAGGDTGYHVRAMKHLLWLAWYGNPEARDLYLDWTRGWGRATIEARHGKPGGIPPGSIWYPSGDIVSSLGGTWWDPHLNYYGWPGLVDHICDAFVSSYALSGEAPDLEAFLRILEHHESGPLLSREREEPGSDRWARAAVQNQGITRAIASYRELTGETLHDPWLLRFGSPTMRFRIDRDFERYARSFGKAVRSLRKGFRLQTSEIIKTDRAGLAGAAATFGAYTGAATSWKDGGLPAVAVTWEAPDPDFAAVVLHATARRLRVRLFRIGDEGAPFAARVWRLAPGRYRVTEGDVVPSTAGHDLRFAWDRARSVGVVHRGERIAFELPAGRDRVLDIRLERRAREAHTARSDLAIAARDLELLEGGRRLAVTIHNIGAAPSGPFAIRVIEPGRGDPVAARSVDGLPPPTGLGPSARREEIPLPAVAPGGPGLRCVVEPLAPVREITRDNNEATLPTGAASAGAGEARPRVAVWTLSSWERALRSASPRPLRPVSLHAAKREWESFQIAVRAGEAARVVGVDVGPLRLASGERLDATGIRVYRAHQLLVSEPTHRSGSPAGEWYPDALVPVVPEADDAPASAVRFRALPLDLPADETHTFWVDVHVPAAAASGEYRGRATVRFAAAEPVEIDVRLRVWPFALPATPALRTAFGSPAGRIAGWYRERAKRAAAGGGAPERVDREALEARCARLMREHRLDGPPPPRLLAIRPSASGAFDLSAEQVAGLRTFLGGQGTGALAVPSPHRHFEDPVRDRAKVERYLRSWDRALEAVGGDDLLVYTYLIDEPNDAAAYEFTRSWGKAIRSCGSRVRVLVTEQTTPQDAGWGDLRGAVDIWVPLASLFDPAAAEARRREGERIWVYTALCQGRPTPWWHLDQPIYHYRIPAWIAWTHRMSGLLYWGGLAYWRQVEDPWTQPETYRPGGSGGPVFNGEGSLLYPARAVGFHGAVPSMRLKALRDAVEDHDYLAILDSLGRRAPAEALVRSVVRGWHDWNRVPLLYQHTRRKLGCLIRDAMAAGGAAGDAAGNGR